jgi:hypothetical protein
MVWLEGRSDGALNGTPWVEHPIQDGPDFLFELRPTASANQLSDKGYIEACAAEYINKRLVYIYGSEASSFNTRVVDGDLGPGFGCTWADLNGDGKLDLLATNHVNQNGSVYAYTWDGDLADASVPVARHVLATGFSAQSTSQGTASPGDAIPFFPKVGNTTGKPFVFISGDNGNYFCVLVPSKPHDPDDWNYTKQMFYYLGSDVGRVAINDTDGDGYNEIFVPAYDAGQVVQFKIKPVNDSEIPATAERAQSRFVI